MGKLQINGDLLLAGNLMMSTSNVSAQSVISVKPDSNAYGQNLIIGAGGNTVIGGGESASAFFTASGIKDEENLYLTADGSIHVYTNCNTIANRKLVMSMGGDGNITTTGTIITPGNDSVVIKPAKHNYDQIGASDCKFWKIHATTFYGNLSGNADTATTASAVAWGNVTGKPSSFTPSSHTHDYLPLAGGGTLTGSAAINFPAGSVSVAASTPMSLSYGRLACYGTLCINANTDNSGTEYVILTAGKGLSSSTSDGLAIGTSTLTWQGSTVLTTGNFPSSSSLARQTDTWISASSLNVNTYYPVVIDIPDQGLCRIKIAVQLNSGTKPSWSTHDGGFTSNIDVEIIAAGWGTVSSYRYLLRQDDWNFSNVKPAYFAGQLTNASKAVFYVRGGGSYRFICDWQDASISLRTSSTTYNSQTVEPTTSTSVFHSGSKSHLYCNVDYASSAGSVAWGNVTGKPSAFTPSDHTHSYLPLSGGTVTGTITSNVAMPFMFYGAGSSTYTCACMYVNSAGMIFETPRAGNSASYAPLPFRVVSRGGWESGYYAPLYCQKVIVQNYGGSLPSSGVTGEIFYKT